MKKEDLRNSENSREQVLPASIKEAHARACQEDKDTYTDPIAGYMVMTKRYHLKRGSCCKSECRHCPWDYKK